MIPLTNKHARTISYRSDIDGLRAIAVIAVLIYHVFPDILPGGYIGVDIFFVISGYLISAIVLKQTTEGTFRLSSFWSSRVWRIFPALCLVLLCTLIYGIFRLQIDELVALASHTAYASVFLTNLAFIRESGYFDTASEAKPLIHLWSLAIETQYYLIWPLIILIGLRLTKSLWIIVLVLFLASFTLGLYELKIDPINAFYLPQMRFWELFAGALLALHNQYVTPRNYNSSIVFVAALAGLCLLMMGFLLFSKETKFPGYWALVPVLGTILLIWAGQSSDTAQIFLSNRYLVYIGLVSYPLYLWHVPLLAYLKIEKGHTVNVFELLGVIFVSAIFATLTYRAVELPLKRFRHNTAATIALVATVLCIGVSAVYILSASSSQTSTAADPYISSEQKRFYSLYADSPRGRWLEVFEKKFRHDCNFFRVEEYYAGSPTRTPKNSISDDCYVRDQKFANALFLWGDSHAQMLRSGLEENLPSTWQILQVTSSGCVPNIQLAHPSTTDYCAQSNWVATQTIRKLKPAVVMLAQHDFHSVQNLNELADQLVSEGVKRVLIVGPAPRWLDDLPKLYVRQLWNEKPERTMRGVNQRYIRENEKLKRLLIQTEKIKYLDLIGLLCDARGCLTRTSPSPTGSLTTWDHGHFTETTSDYVAKKLIIPSITSVIERSNYQ